MFLFLVLLRIKFVLSISMSESSSGVGGGGESSSRNQQVSFPSHVHYLMERNCSIVDEANFPVIRIAHNDENHNSSFEIIESLDMLNEHSGSQFSITCTAQYPIEWVVNYFNNGHPNGNFGLHLQVHRKVGNVTDPSSYKFSLTSKLRYRNNHGFKNFSFSCRSVHNPTCFHTLMYTSLDEEHDGKGGIKINLISGPESQYNNFTRTGLVLTALVKKASLDFERPSPSCDFKVFHKHLHFNRYSLNCQFQDGTPGTVKVVHHCTNAVSCMAFHQQHHQPLLSEKCAQPMITNISCPTCRPKPFRLGQGFLSCVDVDDKDTHPHHVYSNLLFFFSSVPQEDENSNELYFNLSRVNPSKMISLARAKNRTVSVGDQFVIACNTSGYYFASGTKFGVKFKGSDALTYQKGILSSNVEYYPANIYEANIPIAKGTIEKIYCFAPMWNSFEWVNKSIDVQGAVIAIATEVRAASPHIAIAVSITLLLTTLFCCLLFGLCWMKILRRKLSKFGKLLTPQEVDEFRRRPATIFGNEKVCDYDYLNSALMNEVDNKGISYLEIRRESLLLDETVVLGKGHFGKVLKGAYADERNEKMDVAVKTLKTKTDVGALKSLLSELKIMATVGKNLNVVNLIGACTKRMARGEVYVAVEYCANGNLQNYLRTNRDKFQNQIQHDILIVEAPYSIKQSADDNTILSLDLIKWAWEIAKGMEFLSSKKVIHGDLATRNILLTSDRIAKVSDFGLSRQLVDYYYVKEDSEVPMPWRWISIESLRDMKFSIQSDVWSCAVTLWEIFTLAEITYYGCSWSADFVQALESGHRLRKPQFATTEMYDLMKECWKGDPNERPSFFAIKTFFDDIITQCTYQDYMQLEVSVGGTSHSSAEAICRTPLLTLTPTIEVISDSEVEDDVFEQ